MYQTERRRKAAPTAEGVFYGNRHFERKEKGASVNRKQWTVSLAESGRVCGTFLHRPAVPAFVRECFATAVARLFWFAGEAAQ